MSVHHNESADPLDASLGRFLSASGCGVEWIGIWLVTLPKSAFHITAARILQTLFFKTDPINNSTISKIMNDVKTDNMLQQQL